MQGMQMVFKSLLDVVELEYELGHLTSIEQKRLNTLRSLDADAHKASVWVQNNADRFNGLVFGSLMLEVNIRS